MTIASPVGLVSSVLHMDQPDHLVDVAVAKREAGVGALLDRAKNLSERLLQEQEIDLRARGHDLPHFEVAELEGAGEDLCVALRDRAVRDGLRE